MLASSRRRSEPELECLGALAPGVAQALEKMVVGERRRAWVPARLTLVGDGHDGPSTGDETIDLELVEIIKAPRTPADLRSPPASASKTPAGVVVRFLRHGTATRHPGSTSRVRLDFSGWTADGKLIESSTMAGHPATFEMEGVIRGWREALLTMVAGDKVRLWIPAALAYGSRPRRGQPAGNLVYDLELLSID